LPGCSRDGTRKSRAPSGDEAVMIGVWNSVNPWSHIALRSQRTTFDRSIMFWCIVSRRRSRKR
jgi:hypothetical protein